MIRAIDKWLPGYIRASMGRPELPAGLKHLVFCVADHFEPLRGREPRDARDCVKRWVDRHAGFAGKYRDSEGKCPRHTFFYPQDAYDTECVQTIAGLCRAGYGEVEIHLHHRNDTEEGFRAKLTGFRDLLHEKHGLLAKDEGGRVTYGFVHGNWSLCNSRPDGDWCGVNDELTILAETGCYADFTFPSAPSPTQSRVVNTIYRATSSRENPRGFDRVQSAGGLMIIPGPLALNWRNRKWGVLPRVENAEISAVNPPSVERVRLWVAQQIGVAGHADWVFVKVHTHGCVDANAEMLFGDGGRILHDCLQAEYNDGKNWQLHYATARDLYRTIQRLEGDGKG